MTDKKIIPAAVGEGTRPSGSLFTPLGREALMSLPPLHWLVKGLLPAQGLAVVYGPSGAGKSFLLLDLALALARGAQWFGRRTLPAQVYYLCLEGLPGFRNRVRAWEMHHDCRLPAGFHVIAQPFNLRDEVDVEQLLLATGKGRRRAERRKEGVVLPLGGQVEDLPSSQHGLTSDPGSVPQVFVVDTLNRAMAGAEENGSSDMSAALAGAFLLAERSQGLVILVHHTGKDVDRGPRGHSSLVPAADASVLVTRRGTKRLWEAQKVKDGADGLVGEFSLVVEVLGEDEDGETVSSCVVKAEVAVSADAYGEPLPDGLRAGVAALRRSLDAQRSADDSQLAGQIHSGCPSENVELAEQPLPRVDADKFRRSYLEACSAESPSGKRNAYQRALRGMIQRGWVELEGPDILVTQSGMLVMDAEDAHRN